MNEWVKRYTWEFPHKHSVNESVMYGNDNFSSWLLIPSRPDEFLFSSLDMYLPSSETERYGMTNGSCPLVFCLQKSCRGFEHSYTFVLGSINDFDTDKKWLLKTFAVRFFGTSAEVERCPFVTHLEHATQMLYCYHALWAFGSILFGGLFSQDVLLYFWIPCIQGNTFLSL